MTIETKDLIPISKAHSVLQTNRTYNTINNWVKNGVVAKGSGKTIQLKTIQRGGGVYTTRQWYEEFQDKLNEGGE